MKVLGIMLVIALMAVAVGCSKEAEAGLDGQNVRARTLDNLKSIHRSLDNCASDIAAKINAINVDVTAYPDEYSSQEKTDLAAFKASLTAADGLKDNIDDAKADLVSKFGSIS